MTMLMLMADVDVDVDVSVFLVYDVSLDPILCELILQLYILIC